MEDKERSNNTVDIDGGEDFASLLAQYEQSHDPLKSGQVVQGKIVRIFDNEVLVDAGGRSEGVLKKDEIRRSGWIITVRGGRFNSRHGRQRSRS